MDRPTSRVDAGFGSIVWPAPGRRGVRQSDDARHDLALDQVFARLGRDAPLAVDAFETLLGSAAEVEYRQAVFRGLDENASLRDAVHQFLRAWTSCAASERTSREARHPYESELWRLRAVVTYADAVDAFAQGLSEAVPSSAAASEGWDRLVDHLRGYRESRGFGRLATEARAVRDQIGTLDYNVLVRGARVTVARADGESSLGEAVASVFARFRQGDGADSRTELRETTLDHVQAWILERVAQVHPEPFARLARFAADTRDYRDRTLTRFADEVRFYLAYLDYLAPLREAGLPVCYPTVVEPGKRLHVSDTWDLALAARLVADGREVVTNDLALDGPERIAVISGPNQGGKTTMARVFGQVSYLAALGCPVPGTGARVPLCDRVLTLFERGEQLGTLEGRLGAEIDRLHELLGSATDRSVIVLNEAFASTALQDARVLTRDVLERIGALDALAVCVTFIDELSRLNEKTVSMVGAVDPSDPAVRTFRVERRVADGLAYARALARKHGLTAEQIAVRLSAPSREETP